VIASILLSLALSTAQPLADVTAWRTVTAGESVQWGAADGTGQGLRIRCRADGRLEMLGPTAPDALPGTPIRVTFHRGEEQVTLLAVTGMGDESFEVPGAGAPAVLAPLVEACRR